MKNSWLEFQCLPVLFTKLLIIINCKDVSSRETEVWFKTSNNKTPWYQSKWRKGSEAAHSSVRFHFIPSANTPEPGTQGLITGSGVWSAFPPGRTCLLLLRFSQIITKGQPPLHHPLHQTPNSPHPRYRPVPRRYHCVIANLSLLCV